MRMCNENLAKIVLFISRQLKLPSYSKSDAPRPNAMS